MALVPLLLAAGTLAIGQDGGPLPLGVNGGDAAGNAELLAQRHAEQIAQLEFRAKDGDAASQLHLALSLLGEHGRIDTAPVEFWLLQAAAQDYAPAQYMLGMLYGGDVFPKGRQFDLAVRWLRPLALKGDARAQSLYGSFLVQGLGVAQDTALGMTYLTLAAKAGDENARAMLASYRANPPAANPAP